MIVQQLHQIQRRHGYLSNEELRALAVRTGTRLHRLQEVASFFPHFRTQPPPEIQVKVCRDMSCQLRGACNLLKKMEDTVARVTAHRMTVRGVSCLGRCDRAPVASITTTVEIGEDFRIYTTLDEDKLATIIDKTSQAVTGMSSDLKPGSETDLAWQPNQNKQWKIDIYRDRPDEECYAAVRQFIRRNDHSVSPENETVPPPTPRI